MRQKFCEKIIVFLKSQWQPAQSLAPVVAISWISISQIVGISLSFRLSIGRPLSIAVVAVGGVSIVVRLGLWLSLSRPLSVKTISITIRWIGQVVGIGLSFWLSI